MADDTRRVALVTGGAQGIGKAITQRLLRAGYAVVIAEVDAEAGREAAAEYAGLGPVTFAETDTSDEASVRAAVQASVEAYGGLHALVNNADPVNGPVEALALEDWNRRLAVNLTGYFLTVKHAAAHLRRARGAVVNVASTRALQSEPHTEAYAAAKGGVVALTHALAVSLGPDVRVNAVSPGWIVVGAWQKASERETPDLRPADHAQHPAGRVGQPEDVAALVAFLLSDEAGFITGQHYVIDGGMTRKMIYED